MLVIAVVIVACMPGLVAHFDWPLHLYWVQEFARNVSEGTLDPRWIAGANGGYGAPSFVFYGPLAYWIATAGVGLSGSPLVGLKGVYVVAMLVSACSCFVLYRSCGRAAYAIAVAATLSPSLLMLVTRYNLPAAALAAAVSPLVIAGVRSARTWNPRDITAVAIPYALVALAHLPSAFMVAIASLLLAATGLGSPMATRKIVIVAAGLVAGVCLSAFHALPAIRELPWVHADALTGGALDWRVNLLFDPARPFLERARGDGPYLEAIATGLLMIVLIAWMCIERFGAPHRKSEARRRGLCALVLLALCTPLATGFYEFVPGAALLQFGWRWLPLASVFAWSIVATAARVSRTSESSATWFVFPVIAFVASCPLVFGVGGGLPPEPRTTHAQIEWALRASRIDPPEHLPLTSGVTPPAMRSAGTWTTVYGDALATPVLDRDEWRRWTTTSRTDSVARIRTLCYPAWRARIDGVDTPVSCDRDGIMIVRVPAGSHVVETIFAMTGDRLIAMALSALTASLLLVWTAWSKRRSATGASSRPAVRAA